MIVEERNKKKMVDRGLRQAKQRTTTVKGEKEKKQKKQKTNHLLVQGRLPRYAKTPRDEGFQRKTLCERLEISRAKWGRTVRGFT